MKASPTAAGSDDEAIDALVAAEEIRTLFKQGAAVLAANVVNALIVAAVLWNAVSRAALVAWVGAMVVMAAARLALRQRYWSSPPTTAEHARWGRAFVIGSISAGVLWGTAGGFFLVTDSFVAQLLVPVVLGGMGAGAAGTLSCHMPAFYGYFAPSMLPLAIRLLTVGDRLHLAMGAMVVVYIVLFTLIARNIHRAVHEAFRLRFELADAKRELSVANVDLERKVRDRTEELQVQANALRVSESQLAELINESPDAILSISHEGTIVACSPALERILGRPATEVVGERFAELSFVPHAEAVRVRAALEVALGGGPSAGALELELVHADGRKIELELNARLVRHERGEPSIQASLRDVSARTRLEQKLRAAQRLEAIGRLAGGIAHDFNNLLTVTLSNLSVALGDGAMPSESREALEEAKQASQRAADLTRQLLAFGKRQALEPRAVDLNLVVERLDKMLQRLLPENIELELDLDPRGAPVKVDPAQLEQVVVNLAVNARDAMPRGGVLTMRTAREDSTASVVLSVADTGVGLDEATRERMFEPFFSAHGGTGLGLATVHGIVEQSGGSIALESTLGSGTRFDVRFPRTDEVPDAPAAAPAQAVASPPTETILLVEDEELVRKASVRVLRRAGYEVLAAADGPEALALATKDGVRIDALVSDVIMPKMSGPELAERLRAARPGMKVLLVSGYTGDAALTTPSNDGAMRFLAKPFNDSALVDHVRALLDGAGR